MTGVMDCSVALSLRITRPLSMFEDGYFSDGDIKNIIESLGKVVDLDLYNIKKSSKEIILSIKKDVFNKNIQDLIIEIYKKTPLSVITSYLKDCLDYTYPKEKWKVYFDEKDENIVNMEEPDKIRQEKHNYYNPENLAYLLSRDCKYWKDYSLRIKGFKIFCEFSGIDDSQICLLNWFKKDYFKNPLNGALIFHNYWI